MQEALHQAGAAIQRGDANALRQILQTTPSVRQAINEALGPFGARPIMMAAQHRDVLDVLIDFGADINLRSDWENGPSGVLDFCDEPTARHLLTRGAILTAHAAARLGWLGELRTIVDANPDVVHEKGGDGQRPLHFAKTTEIAAFLLDRGAKIDARCVDHHSTAAQYALVDRPEICQFLLDREATPDIFMAARLGDLALAMGLIGADPLCVGARVNLPGYAPVPPFNMYCWTLGFYVSPHDVAVNYGNREVYEHINALSPPIVRFVDAAWNGDTERADLTLDVWPDVRSDLKAHNHAMLAHAAHHQRDDAVKLMIELGFDPAAGGTDGGTALHQAAWVGRADYIGLLLPRCAAILNRPDPTHNATPIGWAAYGSVHRCNDKGDYVRTIELLASAGADLSQPELLSRADGNPRLQEAMRKLGASS